MKKIGIVFSGQGSQYIGMGKSMYNKYSEVKDVYEEASDILKLDVKKLCFEDELHQLARTDFTQIAIYTTSMAMYQVYKKEFGLRPACLAGHSLGEYTALTVSNVISFQDGLKIVQARGRYMQEMIEKNGGCMKCIIGTGKGLVQNICQKYSTEEGLLVVSNYNSPKQNVISGDSACVEAAGAELTKLGARVVEMEVKAPFHSPYMIEASKKLKDFLSQYQLGDFSIPVISNINARVYQSSNELYEMLPRQMVKPVKWSDTMKYMEETGVDTILEIGPKAVLKNLVKRNCNGLDAYSFDSEEDVQSLREKLSRRKTDWKQFVETCIAEAICCKNHNLNNEELEHGFVSPYRAIKEQYYQIKDSGESVSLELAKQSYEMLKSVLETKKVPEAECESILDQLKLEGFEEYIKDWR